MPAPMPVGALTMASFALTAAVIGNAYYQKKQFYPSVVYITKSNPSMAAIYLLAFTMVILLGKLLKKVFFGALRAAEFEHLIERSFYAVTETCLAFTVFRDDFSPKFVALFTVLLFLKTFHWLADYRVDFMERSPVITLLFHVRVTCLLLLLSLLDLVLVNHAYHSTITRGASVQLVFGFEYAILLTVALNIGVKYVCHTVDLQSENPWENKAMYLLYTELCMGFVKVVLYAVFMIIMIRIHTFPLFIIRPMYLTMRSFKRALNDVILSRRAIRNMNTLYPDATPEELRAVDNVCIICREEMLTGAKKLPCGHIFHASCLRSWFQRQQTCPTCRMDILRQPPPAQGGAAGAAAAARNAQQPPTPPAQPQTPQPQQQQRQAQQQMPNPFAGLFAGMPMPVGPPPVGLPPFPFPPMPMHQAQQQQAAAASASASTTEAGTSSSTTTTSTSTSSSASSTGQAGGAIPTAPFNMLPPLFPLLPFNIPPPPPPLNFAAMTEDEVRQLEGNERQHVEARIKVLRNIQTLLDAAVVQMNQYASVVASLDMNSQSIPRNATPQQAGATESASAPEPSSSQAAEPMVGAAADRANSRDPDSLKEATSVTSNDEAARSEVTSSTSVAASPSSLSSTTTTSASADTSTPDELHPDSPQEIRRRRLERFTQNT
ncbi:putative E3 ubiquitin-protein ligase synoviolin isoform X1 [Penaeus vannamei]|uniref:RING-type E3 ubiquitin transferase n=1 Tax=Penaeus vannamei TaxID=6689 RepID=A0A3R7MCI4_PENVA|nr:E3 ubiquitin-protein ligase synoviolin B-like [Penaeus vannamei]ROT72877.1 putative E3 ubiquitin-protein ligase synoviolin isoform X1 [Penaeus vannamei]